MKKEEIGCILTYTISGTSGISGQQLGADGSGNYCVIFNGDPIQALEEANNYIKQIKNFKIRNIMIIPMIEIYTGMPIKIIDINNKGNYRLEILNLEHDTTIKKIYGTSKELSNQLADILENMTEFERINIIKFREIICQ